MLKRWLSDYEYILLLQMTQEQFLAPHIGWLPLVTPVPEYPSTRNELSGIFGGSLYHNALSGIFLTLHILYIYIMVASFVLSWNFCIYEWMRLCVSCAFSVTLLFLFVCFDLV